MKKSPVLAVLSIGAFLALVVAANWMTANLGGDDHMWPVGFGLVATVGTWAAGLVLLARDAVHEIGGRVWVLGCVLVGAALSVALSNPRLALASGAAFAVAELADWAVYEPIRRRGWARAALASGVVGSFVDTVLFLSIAGFPIWSAVPGQMLVKVLATAVVVAIVVGIRSAVLRDRVEPARA